MLNNNKVLVAGGNDCGNTNLNSAELFTPESISLESITSFGNQALGITSTVKTAKLSNFGTTDYGIQSIATTGDFSVNHDCGSNLVAGGSCTLNVSFTPTAEGSRTGNLTITPTTGTPIVQALSGTGVNPISLGQIASFGNQTVGSTSAPQSTTLSNSGAAAYGIQSIATTGDFSVSHNCGATLAAGASCSIQVKFAPTAAGSRTGNLTVTGATGTPLVRVLTGTGINLAVLGSIAPFGNQTVGSTSASKSVTLSNAGTAAYTIQSIAVDGDFLLSHDCGASLAPGGSCTLQVSFAPTAAGTRTGNLTVTGTPGSPLVSALSGTGVNPAPIISLGQFTAFGNQPMGTHSAPRSVTMSNTGTAPYGIQFIAVDGDFSLSHDCGASLAVGASCTLQVSFAPTATGTRSGNLTITGTTGNPLVRALSGNGTNPAPVISLAQFTNFGNHVVGSTSALKSATLSNTGNATYSIQSIAATGDFSVSHDCGSTLPASASCTLNVAFTPTTIGNRTGNLTVTGTPGSPIVRTLNGTGIEGAPPAATVSLNEFSPFGDQTIGATGTAQVATLSNTGTAAYGIQSITVDGDFSVNHDCGSSLAAGASCKISVIFSPTAMGTRTGNLTVTGTTGNPLVRALSGNGISPVYSITADLSLKIAAPKSVKLGKKVSYTFTIKNRSKVKVPNVMVIGNLPEGAGYIKAPPACGVTGQTLTCRFNALGGRTQKQFVVKVKPSDWGALTCNANITGEANDPNLANNTSVVSTRVK